MPDKDKNFGGSLVLDFRDDVTCKPRIVPCDLTLLQFYFYFCSLYFIFDSNHVTGMKLPLLFVHILIKIITNHFTTQMLAC